jgi:hypothetical protein
MDPIMRLIMISPDLTINGVSYSYAANSTYYNRLSAWIDEAKSRGQWVAVGMHKNCLTAGTKRCEIGTDLLNLLVSKKVDIILQGHDHGYQRSKQLAHAAGCTAIAAGAYNAACVADDGSDNNYTKGAGPVILINGVGGRCCHQVNPADTEAPYFARMFGNDAVDTTGFTKFTVSPDRIDAQFVASTGTESDSFSIGSATAPPRR